MSDDTKIEVELAKMSAKLDTISKSCESIEECLFGNGDKEGLRIDVDRLKRSRANVNAVLWVIFTALVGTAATLAAQVFGG